MEPSTRDALRRVDAAVEIGIRLARSAPSGRILLQRIAATIDAEWIPRPWGDDLAAELHSARAAVEEPMSRQAVERALRDAWGTKPTEELDDLGPEPVAVTPTSQVHRGSLDGRLVAVKVLRPGLAGSVSRDLALLDTFGAPLGAAFPGLDPRALIAEFRDRVLEELDLENEASTQRRFHRALRDHPSLMVPAPIMRLAAERVLVSEWVDGVTLGCAPDRDQAAARLLLFTLGGGVAGMVHADPDPDDARVLADGRLAMLDYGAWRRVDPDRLGLARSAFEAFVADDAAGFAAAAEGLGWLPAGHGGAAIELIGHVLDDLGRPGPVRLDADALLAARDRLLARPDAAIGLALAGALPAPDLWPARSVAQLVVAIARVGATRDWRDDIAAVLRDGWDAAVGV